VTGLVPVSWGELALFGGCLGHEIEHFSCDLAAAGVVGVGFLGGVVGGFGVEVGDGEAFVSTSYDGAVLVSVGTGHDGEEVFVGISFGVVDFGVGGEWGELVGVLDEVMGVLGVGGGVDDGEAGSAEGSDGAGVAGGGFGASRVGLDAGDVVVGGGDLGPDLGEVTAAGVVGADEGEGGVLAGFSVLEGLGDLLELFFAVFGNLVEFGNGVADGG